MTAQDTSAPFGAIFDLNGTVVDDTQLQKEAWQVAAGQFGVQLSHADYIRSVAGFPQATVLNNLFGSVSETKASQILAEKRGLYLSNNPAGLETDGFRGFADDLRRHGIPIALATSSSPQTLAFLLDGTNLRHYFDVIVRSDDVPRGKPAPDVYLAAASQLNVEPWRCFAFEDARSGIESAKRAGMFCIGMSTALSVDELRECGADRTYPNFECLTTDVLLSFQRDWAVSKSNRNAVPIE